MAVANAKVIMRKHLLARVERGSIDIF